MRERLRRLATNCVQFQRFAHVTFDMSDSEKHSSFAAHGFCNLIGCRATDSIEHQLANILVSFVHELAHSGQVVATRQNGDDVFVREEVEARETRSSFFQITQQAGVAELEVVVHLLQRLQNA